MTPSMNRMNDFDRYEDAQLMRQKIAAMFAAFVTSEDNTGSIGDKNDSELDSLEPGIIEKLNPGEQITFADPPDAGDHWAMHRKTYWRN